jgi:nucleoside phosphorylase
VKTAVVLTALPVEYLAVRDHLSDPKEERHDQGSIYEVGTFSSQGSASWSVALAEIGMGNSAAAMEAERAIAYFRPEIALIVGVAGGVKDVAIGDVVAATTIYGYESGKTKTSFEPRPNVGICSYRLTQQAMAEAKRPNWIARVRGDLAQNALAPNVFVKPIAAGEKVVASTRSDTYRFIRKYYGDALAVEMEGRGFLVATHANPSVQALVVRGISDLINKKGASDSQGGQHLAAIRASAFAFEILANVILEDNIKYRVEFSGTIQASDKKTIDALVEGLRRLAKDPTLRALRIKLGSIIFAVEGSKSGFSRLQVLLEDSHGVQIQGHIVNSVRLIEGPLARGEFTEVGEERPTAIEVHTEPPKATAPIAEVSLSFSSERTLAEAMAGLFALMPELTGIRMAHGPQEGAVDILFELATPVGGRISCGCLIKFPYAERSTAFAHSFAAQAREALQSQYADERGRPIRLSQLYLVTPAPLSDLTKQIIVDDLGEFSSVVRIVAGPALYDLFARYWPAYIADKADALGQYMERTTEILNSDSSLQRLASSQNLGDTKRTLQQVYIRRSLNLTAMEGEPSIAGSGLHSEDVLNTSGSMIIVGPAGSGKTSLCRMHAIQDVQNFSTGENSALPVYVDLNRYSYDPLPPSLIKMIDGRVVDAVSSRSIKVTFYLDGLDELGPPDKRDQFVKIIGRDIRQQRNTRIILTSQVMDDTIRTFGLPVYALADFDLVSLESLCRMWLDAQHASRFMRALSAKPELLALARSPLFATLLILVFRSTGVLPENRALLYANFVGLFVGGWDLAKGVRRSSLFGPKVRLSIAKRAALTMHLRAMRSCTEGELRDMASATITDEMLSRGWEALRAEIEQDGLLISRSGGVYTFSHLSLQEFLAAQELLESGDPARLRSIMDQYLSGNSWWQTILRFVIELGTDRQARYPWIAAEYKRIKSASKQSDKVVAARAKAIMPQAEA